MEQLIIEGIITTTSMKQSKDFRSDHPRKSLFVSVDAENKKKLEDFGLTEYTPKDGGEPFFILKASKEITVHTRDNELRTIDGTAEEDSEPNFKTDGLAFISMVKGEKNKNEFVRVTDILGDVELIERQDPFADIKKKLNF